MAILDELRMELSKKSTNKRRSTPSRSPDGASAADAAASHPRGGQVTPPTSSSDTGSSSSDGEGDRHRERGGHNRQPQVSPHRRHRHHRRRGSHDQLVGNNKPTISRPSIIRPCRSLEELLPLPTRTTTPASKSPTDIVNESLRIGMSGSSDNSSSSSNDSSGGLSSWRRSSITRWEESVDQSISATAAVAPSSSTNRMLRRPSRSLEHLQKLNKSRMEEDGCVDDIVGHSSCNGRLSFHSSNSRWGEHHSHDNDDDDDYDPLRAYRESSSRSGSDSSLTMPTRRSSIGNNNNITPNETMKMTKSGSDKSLTKPSRRSSIEYTSTTTSVDGNVEGNATSSLRDHEQQQQQQQSLQSLSPQNRRIGSDSSLKKPTRRSSIDYNSTTATSGTAATMNTTWDNQNTMTNHSGRGNGTFASVFAAGNATATTSMMGHQNQLRLQHQQQMQQQEYFASALAGMGKQRGGRGAGSSPTAMKNIMSSTSSSSALQNAMLAMSSTSSSPSMTSLAPNMSGYNNKNNCSNMMMGRSSLHPSLGALLTTARGSSGQSMHGGGSSSSALANAMASSSSSMSLHSMNGGSSSLRYSSSLPAMVGHHHHNHHHHQGHHGRYHCRTSMTTASLRNALGPSMLPGSSPTSRTGTDKNKMRLMKTNANYNRQKSTTCSSFSKKSLSSVELTTIVEDGGLLLGAATATNNESSTSLDQGSSSLRRSTRSFEDFKNARKQSRQQRKELKRALLKQDDVNPTLLHTKASRWASSSMSSASPSTTTKQLLMSSSRSFCPTNNYSSTTPGRTTPYSNSYYSTPVLNFPAVDSDTAAADTVSSRQNAKW